MRLKNKGYTLVELLLSIAVFSIVMVGIASIMSSTLKAYSNANIDVSVQEDCQIAANQIEELLCDAKTISAYDATYGWRFNDGANKSIIYDGSKVCLRVYVGAGYNEYTIADHVTDFSLDNWKDSSDVTSSTEKAYNQVVVNMTMNNNGTTYSLKRNIYFRNDTENNSFHDINNLMGEAGGSGGGGGGTGEIDLTVKRYEVYNLTADQRIRYGAMLYKKNGATWDLKTDPNPASPTTVDNSFFALTKGTSPDLSASFPGASAYYLQTGSSVNSDLDLEVNGTYKVEGYRDSGLTDKVVLILHVDDVDILGTDVVIQHHESDSVNSEGFSSPINVEGININEALKLGTSVASLTFKYNIARNSTVLGAAWSSEKTIPAINKGIVDYNSFMPGQYGMGSERISLGLAPDPFLGGLTVIGNNENMSTCSSLKGDKNLFANFNIVITSGTDSKTFNEHFKFTGLSTGF